MMTTQHNPLTELDRASQLIDRVEQRTGGVASVKQLLGIQRRSGNLLYATIAICLLLSIVAITAVAIMVPRLVRTETGLALNSAAIASAIDTREQLRRAGVAEQDLPPVPEPTRNPGTVDIDSIVDQVTALVLAEVRNDPRYRGPMGPDGKPCDPAINVACIGPEGASGEPGDDGAQGERGEPGEPCSPDVEACRGPAGDDAPRIVNAGPARNDAGVCVFRTTLEDGTIFDAPTREENCPVVSDPVDPAFPDETEGE